VINVHPNFTVGKERVGIARPSAAPLASETVSRKDFRACTGGNGVFKGRYSFQSF
jgi:hypothetical protein